MELGDPFAHACAARGVAMPPVLRDFHGAPGIWAGQAEVTHGRGPLVRLAPRLGGFPPPGTCAVRVDTAPHGWTRDFGGHLTRSRLSFDAETGEIVERFGPFAIRMTPQASPDGIDLAITGLRLFGLPLPRPRSATRERAETATRLRFDVSATAPVLGLIIRYKGWLERQEPPDADHLHHSD
ncbi:DUF4166 domain-containing protein [Mesobacterium pallidum]|uniref:DUF4166 domain-containing protein n=1 Tax=Mesobacterium pallidum TaxID=2872037 RepID=UPI001EE2431C|nr:DUF4166 domain-containing protein [Mesobacterium pallidum]